LAGLSQSRVSTPAGVLSAAARREAIDRRVAQTRAKLSELASWQHFGPALLLLTSLILCAILGLLQALPLWAASLISVLGLSATAFLAWRGWRAHQPASLSAARARIDAEIEGSPLATLADRPAGADPTAFAIWAREAERLETEVIRAPAPRFSPDWQRLDRFYLRWIAPAALAVSLLGVGPMTAMQRLGDLFSPDIGAIIPGPSLTVEAWVSPPAFTGRAPLYLEPTRTEAVSVPAGTTLTVRASASTAPRLAIRLGNKRVTHRLIRGEDGVFAWTGPLKANATAELIWFGSRAKWTFAILPDTPPTVDWSQAPGRTRTDGIDFKYLAQDDYGITEVALVITRADGIAGRITEDRIGLPSRGAGLKSIEALEELNLIRHRWAGVATELQVEAVDGAGQKGLSSPQPFTLPTKTLLQPLAQAAQEIRAVVLREPGDYVPPHPAEDPAAEPFYTPLERAPAEVRLAYVMLEALTYAPDNYFADQAVFLGLRHAYSSLERARDIADAEAIENTLWEVALRAEYGDAADLERAFTQAKAALEKALRDGAPPEEIKRLMEIFREAALNYLAQKMAQGMLTPPGEQQGEGESGPNVMGQDIDDMLKALEDLAATGAADQAQRLLSDLTGLLQNLEFSRPNPSENSEGEQGELSQFELDLMKRLGDLSDLLAQQRALNDQTFRSDRQERDALRNGTPPTGGAPSADDLARQQRELSEALRRQLEGLGEDQGGAGESGDTDERGGAGGESERNALERALRAQERAERALERGDLEAALRAQDEALQAMREGQSAAGERLDAERRNRDGTMMAEPLLDPLGRPIEPEGGFGEDADVPDEMERQRARDLLEEIRRRLSEPGRTPEEREYLRRLLDRF